MFVGKIKAKIIQLMYGLWFYRATRPIAALFWWLKGDRLVKSEVISMQQACQYDNKSIEIIAHWGDRKLFGADIDTFDRTHNLVYFDAPACYVARFANCSIIPGSNLLLLHSGVAVNDMFAHDHQERLFFNDRGFAFYRYPYTLSVYKEKRHLPCGVLLSGNYSFNYFHFMVELMPRFMDIDECVPANIPLLIDQNMLKYPQFSEALKVFNKRDRAVVVLNNLHLYHIDTLYFPTIRAHIVPNLRDMSEMQLSDNAFDGRAIDFVRTTLLEYADQTIKEQQPKKIFVYRNSTYRGFNQDALYDALAKRGFVKVCSETMSVAEQVRLFRSAQVVVGGTGAVFTNLLFCTRGCKAYIINPVQVTRLGVFSSIAKYLGVQLINYSAQEKDAKVVVDVHNNFTLSETQIEELVNHISNATNN